MYRGAVDSATRNAQDAARGYTNRGTYSGQDKLRRIKEIADQVKARYPNLSQKDANAMAIQIYNNGERQAYREWKKRDNEETNRIREANRKRDEEDAYRRDTNPEKLDALGLTGRENMETRGAW